MVIGGTNLMGGRGSMTGTLVGVLIFGFLGNILLLKNIDSNTQLVLKGLIILGAVLLQEGQMAGWLRRFRPRVEKPPGQKAHCGSSRDSTMKADVQKQISARPATQLSDSCDFSAGTPPPCARSSQNSTSKV